MSDDKELTTRGYSSFSDPNIPSLPIKPLSQLEKVRVAFLVHMGDPNLIAEELGMTAYEVKKYLKEIRSKECEDPNQLTADNVAMYVISGIEVRMYHLNKQLKAINGRDQMWRSTCCREPVEEVPFTPGIPATDTTPEVLPKPAHKKCLGCNVGCNIELIDYPTIYRVRNETMRSIREETALYIHTLKELNIIATKEAGVIQNFTQRVVVVGGQPQDYLKLGPMEMDRLLADLRRDIVRIDEDIKKSDEEIAQEEAELLTEEAKVGKEDTDSIREEKAVGETPTGEGEEKKGLPEEKG